MRIAETVTFGGSGLDRAAELRGDPVALEAMRAGASTILLWRGKPLVMAHPDRSAVVVRLPLDHPVLAEAGQAALFLGREDGKAVFAHDLSGWTPENTDEAALNSFLDRSEQHHPSLPPEMRFAELRGLMTRINPRDAELSATARALFSWHRSHRFCAMCGQESAVAMAGWQRDCAACGGHHFPRTDPVVIMAITDGNDILMGRSPGWPEGMYSLLAGFVEPGETIEAAVRREVWEEAGVRVGAVSYLASQPWAFPSSLMIGCLGQATSREITIDPKEIEDARWFSREEIALAFSGQHPILMPARKGAIAQFILRNWLADRLD
ncbi:NAD(+) diphosphatase [Thalassovita taeanensis]|uniref:NAD(+) diphosphatase n=1 Tax=Thalassovita taeanensis TaxID=657014 RepID=A0A1H9CM63_9RHOB|nr:NAD(+) diphosphatase [Thalassovita taeanensis]SEQ02254.1 NAD+ diphosphatase [Thalassovita taeanensis]